MAGNTYLDIVPIIGRPRTVNGVVVAEQPYTLLPGSALGATSPDVTDSANAIALPLVDSTSTDGKPDTYSNPSASDFLSWHTAWQIRYIKEKNASGLSVTIGSGTSQITAFVGDGTLGEKVFVVENLQKSDIGLMNLATQERLSGLAAWDNASGVADKLGYKRRDGSSVSALRNTLKAVLDASYLNLMVQPSVGPMSGTAGLADLQLFKDQIENIKTRIDNSSVFQEANIKTAAEAILTRYKRAAAFSVDSYKGTGSPPEGKDWGANAKITKDGVAGYPDYYLTPDSISTDGNVTIINGYNKFIADEVKLLEADKTRLALGALVSTQMKNVDLPRMIFLLQMTYDLTNEQQSAETTEELRQQNKYLQDISLVQRLLNNTLAKFGTGTDETKALLDKDGYSGFGRGARDGSDFLTKEESFMLGMFEKFNTTERYATHPIETLRGITSRPTLEILDTPLKYDSSVKKLDDQTSTNFAYWFSAFKAYPKSTWEKYNTNISDHVALVSQESQIKQNEINSFDRERNRHYELANNALQKMFDMIGQIART